MALVTIVSSVYNVAPYLERFIQSMKAQTFKDFTVLFVNDGTPDQSIEIIQNLVADDDRFQYVHVDQNDQVYCGKIPENHRDAVNKGIYATRNTALKLLSSKYFTFIDPDDWLDPDYFEKLIHTAETTQADLNKAELCRDYEDGKVKDCPKNARIQADLKRNWPSARVYCGSQSLNTLFKTEFASKHHLAYKDRTDGFEYDSDDIFLLEYQLLQPTIAFCNQTRYHYFQRSTSAVHTINHKRYISTTQCRNIEMQCLNNALESGYGAPLPPFHYAVIARRILWELAKHYRIYLKADNFDKKDYLAECAKVVSLVQWNDHINVKSLGFLNALLNQDFDKAHFLLTNPLCILLDKIRLLPYGI